MRTSGSSPSVTDPPYVYSITKNEVVDRGLGIPQADTDAAESQLPVTLQLTDEQARSIVIDERPAVFQGSLSDVHRGHWTSPWTGRLEIVAIKVLRPANVGSRAADVLAQRLVREVRIWQKLKGPRITPLLGYIPSALAITYTERPAMISPWRKFGTLNHYVNTNPQADRLTLLIQAAEAINMLHTLKPSPILHLDIKPGNFLINDDGQVELFDFGISRELEDVDSGPEQESFVGLLPYQPPEVLAGETKSTAADVYAFGGVILEVLTGKEPFAGMKRVVTMIKIIQGETPNRDAYSFSYPSAVVDEFWKLMNDCWRVAQNDRPTMAVVIERLNQIATMMKDDSHK
ncbi:hypothetical protein FS837_012731 [Tulasnella sp. UAMH 9824]|nr:hypothetical protein FS837_012731 [Tulasnella sp. UAMH 9824]